MRGGPGLGNIAPAQADYFQVTRGLGHGDVRGIVLGPSSVQEIVELVPLAFELAERYRLPSIIAADGILGQMMEAVALPDPSPSPPAPDWATTGAVGDRRHLINSIHLAPEALERHVLELRDTYREIERREPRWEVYQADDAEIVVVAYGIAARIARSAVDRARAAGVAAGLVRPITLWPFPVAAFDRRPRRYLVVELNTGMMIDDVRLAVNGRVPVDGYGRLGGMVPSPVELTGVINKIAVGEAALA
jgi:2-oxoglutarate ferredoxin oxidoreductase subunit alpha